MARVTSRTANWRLFGGSALIIAAILWILFLATSLNWLQVLAFLVLAAGLIIVAFGQTGGNGAVGKYVLGKVALVLFAAGWVIFAINALISVGNLLVIGALLIIVAGLISAWAIERKSVAKGAARWIMFLPAVVGALAFAAFVFPSLTTSAWVLYVLAVLFGITGALYLLNDRKIG
jgi:hypothetical protein